MFERLTVSGCSGYGIYAGLGSRIIDCRAVGNAGTGIHAFAGAALSGCTALENGGTGIDAYSGTFIHCTATSNGTGIRSITGGIISQCTSSFNTNFGIVVGGNAILEKNSCYFNKTAIRVTGSGNRIDGNHLTRNQRGLHVLTTGNIIIRNTAHGESPQWEIAPNNQVGIIVVAPDSPIINGNTGGSGVGSTDPWANISIPNY